MTTGGDGIPCHFSYGRCERCCRDVVAQGSTLAPVEFWDTQSWNGKHIESYLYVCDACFERRSEWGLELIDPQGV